MGEQEIGLSTRLSARDYGELRLIGSMKGRFRAVGGVVIGERFTEIIHCVEEGGLS